MKNERTLESMQRDAQAWADKHQVTVYIVQEPVEDAPNEFEYHLCTEFDLNTFYHGIDPVFVIEPGGVRV